MVQQMAKVIGKRQVAQVLNYLISTLNYTSVKMCLLFETITYVEILSQEKLSSGLKLLVVNRSKDIGAGRHQYQVKEVLDLKCDRSSFMVF